MALDFSRITCLITTDDFIKNNSCFFNEIIWLISLIFIELLINVSAAGINVILLKIFLFMWK
jgi:hypothetical protein